MTTTLGALGTFLLAYCAWPLVRETLRTGQCRHLPWDFIGAWLLGEFALLAYVLMLPVTSVWLVINYAVNAGLVGVILWYRVWPRVKSLEQMAKEMGNAQPPA